MTSEQVWAAIIIAAISGFISSILYYWSSRKK